MRFLDRMLGLNSNPYPQMPTKGIGRMIILALILTIVAFVGEALMLLGRF